MPKKGDLNFEETIFDTENDLDCVELPLAKNVFLVIIAATFAITFITLSRLMFLGVTRGNFYAERSLANVNRETSLPAKRGLIVDRYGVPLVKNEPVFSAFLNVREFLRKDLSQRERFIGDIESILGSASDDGAKGLSDVINSIDLESASYVAIERGIDTEGAIALKGLNDPAIQIQDDYRRGYIYGASFAHVLGYTGTKDDRSIEGKYGLEAYYDHKLRGKDGKFVEGRDVHGNVLYKRVDAEPVNGSELKTTLDAELQNYFYDRLKSGLESLGREAGAGVILNPQTGEILSLVSLPSFDDNIFTLPGKNEERRGLIKSKQLPLFNRPVSGLYNPGSTIKPMMALAALHEGVTDPALSVYSAGFIELPNPYDPEHPSRFLDWKAHGWVNLYSALARSSNIYFYAIGGGFKDIKGLGIKRIEDYFKKFGFDQKTGVDIAGESAGALYGPEYRERQGRIWRIGDTYNISIGQGDMTVVPLRLIDFIGAIGVGGKMKQPFLVSDIKDGKGNTLERFRPKEILDFSDLGSEILEVRKGLEAAVNSKEGTARQLADLPITVAGKTGSAQILQNTKVNAFFVGYAPAQNPEIAMLVLVEDAKEGSLNTIPIAKDVFKWYYEHRLNPSAGRGQALSAP